jgi:hypothetical protein
MLAYNGDTSPATPLPAAVIAAPDEIEAFLARAGALDRLVQLGELEPDDAFDALIDRFLEIVFPIPENPAEAFWNGPSWRAAAIWYREELRRTGRPSLSPLVVRVSKGEAVFHPDIDFYRRLLDDDITIDRAWRAIDARRARQ